MSNRRKVAVVALPLGTAAILGELFLTPQDSFANSFYWIGFASFFVVGVFLFGSNSKKLQNYGRFAFLVMMSSSFLLSRSFPNAEVFFFGFIGVLVGIGLKLVLVLAFFSRWSYCRECGSDGWLSKKNGKWVCQKAGHQVNLSTRHVAESKVQDVPSIDHPAP